MATAQVSEPLTGDKLYQQRARAALPLLVRQASAGEPITYENLAGELGMPNARNLNYVLGSIGQSIIIVGKEWQLEVPPIQCLVVNKNSGLPGEGISEFLGTLSDYRKLTRRQRRQVLDVELAKIYGFSKWAGVLEFFGLSPAEIDFGGLVDQAQKRGAGESEAHRVLKAYVARQPQIIGLPSFGSPGEQEYALPSGDFVDVFFENRSEHIGVEVKPMLADEGDVTRGIYQCIKYQAVLEAMQSARGRAKNVRTVLVLAGLLPKRLMALKNLLGVEVIDGIVPPST